MILEEFYYYVLAAVMLLFYLHSDDETRTHTVESNLKFLYFPVF